MPPTTPKRYMEANMQHCTTGMLSLFEQIFNPESCNQLAKKSGFIQRSSSRIHGHEFIKTMIIPNNTLSEDSLNGLCLRMSQFNSEAEISASALSQRINTVYAVNLMKACMEKILSASRKQMIKQYDCEEGILSQFNNIYIQDSTVFELNKHLHGIFKGTKRGGKKGGSSCKAQVKIDLIQNYSRGTIEAVQIYEGKRPDQALTGRIMNIIQGNDLVIRDLGYFKLETLRSVSELGAYFLTRFPTHIKVYLNPDDKNSVNLSELLKKKYKYQSMIEINVWIGEIRLPVRLIAYKMPREIVEKRLRRAHKGAKEMGRTLSKAKLDLLEFSLFVTNIPENMISAEMIGTIYRLRWEIELTFKQWKSLLKIDVLKGINRYRVECMIWSRVCLVIIIASLTANFMNLAKHLCGRELSPTKLIFYLIRDSKLAEAVKTNNLEKFEKIMIKDMKIRLLKDKRSRPTTREMIAGFWSYYEHDKCA
jgi:hypothetical protein